MERQKSSLDNGNKRCQNPSEKPSDASPSERLQKSRDSHLIGSGRNPHEWSNQQVGADEAREKNAITTPSDTDLDHRDKGTSQESLDLTRDISSRWSQDVLSDHSSTQDRNEKRQLSALEEALEQEWLKSIPLDEYGYRIPKIIELTGVPTRDKLILVGGVKDLKRGWRFWEKGGSSKQGVEQYRLVRFLGDDSLGQVHLGEHIHSKEPVAVKLLLNQSNPRLVEQFHKEAETLKKLNHPYIVRGLESGKIEYVLEFGRKEKVECLVMEYTPKGTLRDAYPQGTRLSPEKVVTMVNDLADALDYLHNYKDDTGAKRSLVHMNLKPETVSLGAYGRLLLNGFRLVKEVNQTASQVVAGHREGNLREGTAEYMDPAYMRGKPASPASDLYQLAVMVYEWLSGELPFRGNHGVILGHHLCNHKPESLVGKIQEVPDEEVQKNIQDVVFKALEKDPKEREKYYKNIKIFAEELEKACFGCIRKQQLSRKRLQELYQEIAVCDKNIHHNSDDIKAHYKKGKALSELEHYKEAVAAYNEAIRINPQLVDAHFNQGVALAKLGEHQKAVDAFNETIRLYQTNSRPVTKLIDPGETIRLYQEYVEAHYRKGKALAELKRYEEAVDAYNQTIDFSPEHVGAHFDQGVALAKLGEHQKAVDAFDKTICLYQTNSQPSTELIDIDEAMHLNQEHVEAHYRRGKALYELKHYGEAVAAYYWAIHFNPEHVNAHFNMGKALYELGDNQGAVVAYEKAIRLNPGHVDAYYQKGNALSNLGHHREAVEAYDQVFRINPEHADAFSQRENALRNLNRNEVEVAPNAPSHVENVSEDINHNEVEAGYNAPSHVENVPEDINHNEVEVAPNAPSHVENVSEDINHNEVEVAPNASSHVENVPEDINHNEVEVASNASPHVENVPEDINHNEVEVASNILSHVENAPMYINHHEVETAHNASRHPETPPSIEELQVPEETTRLNLERARACYQSGLELSGLRRNGEAVDAFSEAICLNPEHADAYYHRGNAFSKLGRHQEAVADYEEATRLNPEHARAHYQMGIVLSSLGRHGEAMEAYDESIRLNLQWQQTL